MKNKWSLSLYCRCPYIVGAGNYSGPSHTHTVSKTAFGSPTTHQTGVVTTEAFNMANHMASQDAATSSSGTGAVTGTSASADSRPEFATVIFCQKE